MSDLVDIVVVGAGAAGLTAAIEAARDAPGRRIVAVDGARKLGAKILVSGGGRCNVTNEVVSPADFAGGSRNSIRKVLGRFTVADTIAFFEELGVELKREEGGKLFPTSDSARTIFDALLAAARTAGVAIRSPFRVDRIERTNGAFRLHTADEKIDAARVVLSTGGKSLPRTGSDGGGYALARALGHTTTQEIFPALVPLRLADGHRLTQLSGLSAPARLTVAGSTGKRLASVEGSLLCTHFGLSGPAALDVSRHFIEANSHDADAALFCDWLPDETFEECEAALMDDGPQTPYGRLRRKLPERLAAAIFEEAGVRLETPAAELRRESRRALVQTAKQWRLEVSGNRGWNFAEVTAGGIPLDEIDPRTMASRKTDGLYLCGEICDVDGRIGGFNFQWAWASGAVAGRAAAVSLDASRN
jgi:predicted Rossmann fold flavoprotein